MQLLYFTNAVCVYTHLVEDSEPLSKGPLSLTSVLDFHAHVGAGLLQGG